MEPIDSQLAKPLGELTVDVGEIARLLFATGSVEATLVRIVELAVETIEARTRISADAAFDILRRASQLLINHKVRDVAQDLVDTGERPALPLRPGHTSSPFPLPPKGPTRPGEQLVGRWPAGVRYPVAATPERPRRTAHGVPERPETRHPGARHPG